MSSQQFQTFKADVISWKLKLFYFGFITKSIRNLLFLAGSPCQQNVVSCVIFTSQLKIVVTLRELAAGIQCELICNLVETSFASFLIQFEGCL